MTRSKSSRSRGKGRGRSRGLGDPERQQRSDRRLLAAFFGKALVERTKVDHDSLVSAIADLLCAVAGRHLEVNSFALDLDDLGRRPYVAADRRGGGMAYIHRRAPGAP